jgi:ATP-dependent DNA ligase
LDYAEFEGEIPAGQYGAGTVVVWDAGTYRNQTERAGNPVPTAQAVRMATWLCGWRDRS